MAKYHYPHFIPENTATVGAKRIGIYNRKGNRVGFIPLGNLAPRSVGNKLYSFGAISDVHLEYDTGQNDFQTALTYFDGNTDIDFLCICGDFHRDGTNSELAVYKSYIDTYFPSKPVYAIPGNHENYPLGIAEGNIADRIEAYTGKPSYYSFTQGNDVFVMVGINSNTSGTIFASGELQWLYDTLEANRNKRCFVFIHPRPDDGCGDVLNLYGNSLWAGTEKTVFESLVRHYPNCILFHGHTHMRFSLQEYGDTANYDNRFGCHSVHIPSLASPREDTNNDGIWDNVYADSEGYVVDVYENGIHLRGRDFVNGAFLPIASYWLDTALQTVEDGTYIDPTGTLNTRIPSAYQQVEYIEATGTQYIDTGIVPTNHMIEVKYSMDEYVDDTHVFGTALSWQWFHFTIYQNTYRCGLSGTQVTGSAWSAGVKTLLFNYGDNHEVIQDGEVFTSGKDIYSTESVTLCRRNVTKFYGKYYYFNITDRATGALVRNMIPCYRKSDGVIGMYDTVSKQFFVNLGTGTFGKGADV